MTVRRLALAGACVAATAQPPTAADWRLTGSVAQRVEADDNLRLRIDREGPSFGSITEFGLNLAAVTPRTRFALSSGVSGRAFITPEEGADLTRTDPRLSGRFSYDGQRWSANSRFSFSIRPTTFADIEEALDPLVLDAADPIAPAEPIDPVAPGEIVGPIADDAVDGDFTDRDAILISLNGSAGLSYVVDGRNRLSGSVSTSVRRFTDDDDQLTPSTSFGVSGGWRRSLDPVTGASVRLSGRRVDFENDENTESQSVNLSFGFDRQLTPRLALDANAGGAFVTTERDRPVGERSSNSDVSFTGGLDLNLDGEGESFRVGLSQNLEPDLEDGGLDNRARLRMRYTRQLSPRSRVSLGAGYTFSNPLVSFEGDEDDDEERQRFTLAPTYNYNVSPDWRLSLGYLLRVATDDTFESRDDLDAAYSNKVFLRLSRGLTFIP